MSNENWVVNNILPVNKSKTHIVRNGVTPVKINYEPTRKTKITFCLLGSWAAQMPPYGLARMTAATRAAGFETRSYDFNIHSYHFLKTVDPSLEKVYEVSHSWWWQDAKSFYEKILPSYSELLEEYIDTLLIDNPDIIGFSLYWTNRFSTRWVIDRIRELRPDITLIMGGPEVNMKHYNKGEQNQYNVDYSFRGESEKNILAFLEDWERGIKPPTNEIGELYSRFRVNIDSLPFPDYSDYPLHMYKNHMSVCTELSRGCVAKCNYCTEVLYWKFRDRDEVRVMDEIEYQIKEYGVGFLYFVDSLVNGNLKGFKAFLDEKIKRNNHHHWWAYARHDGRMDLDFYKLLAKAKCDGLNYGLESASDRVLKAINKGNTSAEIDQNLRDAYSVGLRSTVCLVLGAPGEYIEDFILTMACMWTHRWRIFAVSPGPGLGITKGAGYDDHEKFNISPMGSYWLYNWYTLDFMNTQLHRYIRIKQMHILLDIAKDNGGTIANDHQVGDMKDHYTIEYHDPNVINEDIYPEQPGGFDYNIIESGLGVFADSSMNEIFALLRMIWFAKGGYKIKIKFNHDQDVKDFGFALRDVFMYNADIDFEIDAEGNYTVNNYYKFDSLVDMKEKSYEYRYKSTGKWINNLTHTHYTKEKMS